MERALSSLLFRPAAVTMPDLMPKPEAATPSPEALSLLTAFVVGVAVGAGLVGLVVTNALRLFILALAGQHKTWWTDSASAVSASAEDRQAPPWLRRRERHLRAEQAALGRAAYPPLPPLRGSRLPLVVEPSAHPTLEGEMTGWVWVCLGSDWDGRFFPTHPPTEPDVSSSASGEGIGRARRWWGELLPAGDNADAESSPASPLLRLKDSPDAPKAARSLLIPLAGCCISVSRDGDMRDAWPLSKRGPLVLARPLGPALLGSDRSLCLFLYNAALKEQWFRAFHAALEPANHPATADAAAASAPWGDAGRGGPDPDLDALELGAAGHFGRWLTTRLGLVWSDAKGGDGLHSLGPKGAFLSPGVGPRGGVVPPEDSGGDDGPGGRGGGPFSFGLRRVPGLRRFFGAAALGTGAAGTPAAKQSSPTSGSGRPAGTATPGSVGSAGGRRRSSLVRDQSAPNLAGTKGSGDALSTSPLPADPALSTRPSLQASASELTLTSLERDVDRLLRAVAENAAINRGEAPSSVGGPSAEGGGGGGHATPPPPGNATPVARTPPERLRGGATEGAAQPSVEPHPAAPPVFDLFIARIWFGELHCGMHFLAKTVTKMCLPALPTMV